MDTVERDIWDYIEDIRQKIYSSYIDGKIKFDDEKILENGLNLASFFIDSIERRLEHGSTKNKDNSR